MSARAEYHEALGRKHERAGNYAEARKSYGRAQQFYRGADMESSAHHMGLAADRMAGHAQAADALRASTQAPTQERRAAPAAHAGQPGAHITHATAQHEVRQAHQALAHATAQQNGLRHAESHQAAAHVSGAHHEAQPKQLKRGAKGGQFYISPTGKKVYVR